MTYEDIEAWSEEEYPVEDFDSFEDRLDAIESNFAESGHHFPSGMVQQLAKDWKKQTGEQVNKQIIKLYEIDALENQAPTRDKFTDKEDYLQARIKYKKKLQIEIAKIRKYNKRYDRLIKYRKLQKEFKSPIKKGKQRIRKTKRDKRRNRKRKK